MPIISILLAVHNGGNALYKSVGSLQVQTMKDIEIVCINDASTDNSLEILHELAVEDERIRIVTFDQNKGTVCARKSGIEIARGEYIMFMDQDDFYEPFACEELYKLIREKNVDVLHFRAKVIAIPPTTEKQRKWQEDFMHPYNGFLYGEDVFFGCFGTHKKRTWNKYTWNLWNKIYKTEICKTAMCQCREDYIVNGDDIYIYMLIAYYAQSYYGDANGKFYYVYNFGMGLMGNYDLNIKKFRTICYRTFGVNNEREFLSDKGFDGKYDDVLLLDYSRCLCGILQRWYGRLASKDRPFAFDMMLNYLPTVDVIAGFARDVRVPYSDLLASTDGAKSLQVKKREIKTIGVYFSQDIKVPRTVTEQLLSLWEAHGYSVICFTEESNPVNFDNREVITLLQEHPSRVFELPLLPRMEHLKNALLEHGVDAYVYTGRKNKYLAHDMLLVKSHGLPFILDACELPLYNKDSNNDTIGYYRYLEMMRFTNGILLPDKRYESILTEMDITFTDGSGTIFADSIAPQNRNSSKYKTELFINSIIMKKYSDDLETFLGNKSVRRILQIIAILNMYNAKNLTGKLKLLGKLALRCIGIKKEIHYEDYNLYIRLKNLSDNLKSIYVGK